MCRLTAPRYILACVLSLALLTSCSEGESFEEMTALADQPGNFSEQEKLAAQKLSMGNSTALDAASGPYEESVLCRSAIEALAERFREMGGPGETQVRAIEQAAAIFDRRLETFGSREGKSDAAIRRDLQQAREGGPEIGAQAQLAVTCLQRLQ